MTMEAITTNRTPRRRSARKISRAQAAEKRKPTRPQKTAKPAKRTKRAQAERVVSAKASSKTPMLSFRMDAETRELVDHAASLAGQNRTDFMVTVLREKAIEVILDRRLFLLNDTDWNAFTKHLDEPPASNAKLKALLSRKPVWDQ